MGNCVINRKASNVGWKINCTAICTAWTADVAQTKDRSNTFNVYVKKDYYNTDFSELGRMPLYGNYAYLQLRNFKINSVEKWS